MSDRIPAFLDAVLNLITEGYAPRALNLLDLWYHRFCRELPPPRSAWEQIDVLREWVWESMEEVDFRMKTW